MSHAAGHRREPRDHGRPRHRPHLRRHLDDPLALAIMRLGEDVGHAHAGRVQDIVRREPEDGFVEPSRPGPGLGHVEQLDRMGGASLVTREFRIVGEIGLPEHRAQPLDEVLGRRGEGDPMAMLGAEGASLSIGPRRIDMVFTQPGPPSAIKGA